MRLRYRGSSKVGLWKREPCREVVGVGPAIAKRLLREGHKLESKPEDCRVRRLYTGHWQRATGAWSWELVDLTGERGAHGGLRSTTPVVGSQWKAKEVLRWKLPWTVEYDVGVLHIDPHDDEDLLAYA